MQLTVLRRMKKYLSHIVLAELLAVFLLWRGRLAGRES